MATPIPVYLAGPDVFLRDALEIGRRKREICARLGLDGRFPLDGTAAIDLDALPPHERAATIRAACIAMMDECRAGIANFTPFRGISADVGTAFEAGYLQAQRKPVFGYSSELLDYAARVTPDGMEIEAFGLGDNLMVAGGPIEIVRLAEPPATRLAAFAAFEAAARAAAAAL